MNRYDFSKSPSDIGNILDRHYRSPKPLVVPAHRKVIGWEVTLGADPKIKSQHRSKEDAEKKAWTFALVDACVSSDLPQVPPPPEGLTRRNTVDYVFKFLKKYGAVVSFRQGLREIRFAAEATGDPDCPSAEEFESVLAVIKDAEVCINAGEPAHAMSMYKGIDEGVEVLRERCAKLVVTKEASDDAGTSQTP